MLAPCPRVTGPLIRTSAAGGSSGRCVTSSTCCAISPAPPSSAARDAISEGRPATPQASSSSSPTAPSGPFTTSRTARAPSPRSASRCWRAGGRARQLPPAPRLRMARRGAPLVLAAGQGATGMRPGVSRGRRARGASADRGGRTLRGLARDARAGGPRTGVAMALHVVHVVGARPNFMKLAPVYAALAARESVRQTVVHTGQHYDVEMSAVFFRDLGLPPPDRDLEVGSGSHAQQTAQIMMRLEPLVLELKPDVVLVYG